ncbi:MAG TPA: hypothetical protein VJS20_06135 [Gemmatimonadales bacterium]|nr:hypothetical protein [Gemmatimonadales bacterium]
MFALQQSLPEQWRETLQFVASGFTWILDWQRVVLGFSVTGDNLGLTVLKAIVLLLPSALLVAAVWCTMASLYTLPFRSGRGGFLTALLLSWWDAGRMIWFYWAGLLRFVVVLLGWLWGLVKLAGSLLGGFLKFIFTRPLALLDWATRQYFQPGVPWIAFLFILFWSALEATIFTFTLKPTLTEVLAGITGTELSGFVVGLILWPFLFILISGSFAAIQALTEAIRTRKVSQIVSMVIVEAVVMLFEVLFLYRELIDAITPWINQQTGFQMGFVSTLALASFGWMGVRAMTWFLFGRFGTPALLGILGRQSIAGASGHQQQEVALQPDFWKGPITALKAETEWFRKEAREVFELMTLPVLQVLAAGLNFAVVVILGKPVFVLPFRNLEAVLASTPQLGRGETVAKHPTTGAA